MSWERDPLWAKARLFIERAFEEPRESPAFGLWCSLGLELLARAALASISPTLLADPNPNHKNLLYALGRSSKTPQVKSIGAAKVFMLCEQLFPEFTEEDRNAATALISRRNEELHSGAAAFDDYRASQWLTSFYRACQSLCSVTGDSLDDLFGAEEGLIAKQILGEYRNDTKKKVLTAISDHRKAFQTRPEDERRTASEEAEKRGSELATQRHHRVTCPACGSVATSQGRPVGRESITDEDGEIVVRQTVVPRSFSCSVCGLTLEGYANLDAAGLGDHYTRTARFSPEEYYGLVDPDDVESLYENYRMEREYDNE